MTARYRSCGVVLLRSTTDPGDIDIAPDLDLNDPNVVLNEGVEWLAKAWARSEVRDAITVASPDLSARISQLLDEPGTGARDMRRAILSAASYVRRWQRRVTPFGLFAGVMPPATGPASGSIAAAYQVVARADADWIAALTHALDRDAELRPRLTVIASNLAIVRDSRLVVSRRAQPGSAGPGQMHEASVRWTRPVQAAVETASMPVQVAALAGELAEQFPGVTSDKIRTLLDGLIDEGFLITSLHAPMTAADPLASLLGELRAADAEDVPSVAPLLRGLQGISELLALHNACARREMTGLLRAAVTTRMTTLAPHSGYPLAIDVRLNGHVTIPGTVLNEATAAAEALLRLTTRPFGSPGWVDYHARFRERYGPGALVPVTELISDSGLGYPDGFPGASRQRPAWRMLTERDAALLALIQQAALAGADEIRLTDADIQALTTGDHADLVAPPRIEIGVSLHAESSASIDRGDFELRLTAAPRTPTSMAGRFAHLLTDAERDQFADSYRTGETGGTLAVQLSFPPRRTHDENVVRVAPLVAAILPLGEHPAAGTISIDDLAVTADAAQMYLIHRPTDRRVIPRIPHALDLTAHTPPLARFIAEVADARTASFGPPDLGAARVLPYVPRIRYRRTVLAPARWLLSAKDVIPAPDDAGWASRFGSWRQRWKVPARVILCADELRLPLDLDHGLDRALLQAHLERSERAELREDTPPEGDGWLGRPVELLIPLALASPAPRPLPVTASPGRTHRPGASPVVCARITGNPARFDDVIAGHLPELMTRLAGMADRWWLRRHRDMVHPWSPQHVAVLVRLRDPRDFAEASAELAAFAADLEARGLPADLTLASYTEHPGRYGRGEAMSAAEDVFAADTSAAIAQIAMATATGIHGQALAAASMDGIAAAFAPDPETGYRALTESLERGAGLLDRAVRDQACQLADPTGSFRELRALQGGDAVAAAWGTRDAALAAYHEELAAQRDPGTVLRTLLHEHHMRALGIDPDFERQTGRYARAAALRRLALAGWR